MEEVANTVVNGEDKAEDKVNDGAIAAEQLKKIRGAMLDMYQKNYRKFMESIREMPIHPQFMHQPSLFFDTASLWMKEIIEYAPLIQKQNLPQESNTPENAMVQ